jgi:uncharacterized protein YegP (UPF0339 family)
MKHHPDGLEVYRGLKGDGKGAWRARFWRKGRIIAESGEAFVKKSEADEWPARLFDAIADVGIHD